MKTCGYCGRTYDDSQPRCPSCGSTLLKHSHGEDSAAADYDRIKKDIEKKRKSRSKILIGIAAAAVLVVIICIISVVSHVNDPQRAINANASAQYESALNDVQAGKYDSALSTLNSIDASWSDYNKAISLKQKAVSGMLQEKANGYMANKEYEAIIKLITTNVENIDSDPEIKSLYDSAAASYREQVIQKAEQDFSDNGYQAAISAINSGLSVLPGDNMLENEKSYYASFAPVDLTTLTPYIQQSGMDTKSGMTDTMGNTYASGIYSVADLPGKGEGVAATDKETCWVWDIGGQYNSLTATGFIFESDKDLKSLGGTVRIYGDNQLLYEKYNITCDTKPYTINVDVTGVTDLKIELYGESSSLGWSNIYGCLGNITLQKTK